MTKKYSFWNLISKYHIEIPAIQRDYAQGRKTEERVAKLLINDLFNALKPVDAKKINLHFVYGKIVSGEDERQTLIPLDGQQRLTTLFLLHWFLSINILSADERNTLVRFTYETRPSSKDFCFKLVKEGIKYKDSEKISGQIKKAKWFFLSWENDPTILAMLNMLDIIRDIFGQPDEIKFKNLIKEDSPVQFHFLPLDRFNMDDKIYVKMNSRGKPLTDFENFKAKFSVLFDIENKECKSKLDNEWLDIFWNFEKEKEEISVKEVDKKFYNFLINATFNFCAEIKDIDKDFKDNFYIFDEYKSIYSNSKTLEQLIKILNSLISFNNKEKYFVNFLKDNPDYDERLHFYAVMQFFINKGDLNNVNKELYDKWLRVCKNLINNTRIEDPEDFYKAIRSMKELSGRIDGLYEYLSKPENEIGGIFHNQAEEEKVKAKLLLLQNEDWKTEIHDTEEHCYFDGQIGFILDFSKENGIHNLKKFKDYSAKLKMLFSDTFKNNKNCLFQRALLASGDYLVPISGRLTFCTFNEGLREKIDNWRKVFGDEGKKEFLKNLLDAIHIDCLENDLQGIIDKYSENDWKSLFIKNKGIIEYCTNYRIAKWGNKIALARSPAPYWRRHADLYSYVLSLELQKEKKNVDYEDSTDYEPPRIKIKWKEKDYYIQETETDYDCGSADGKNDPEGLNEMKQYIENIIKKKNLQKGSLFATP